MRSCQNCGLPLGPGSNICPQCGVGVESSVLPEYVAALCSASNLRVRGWDDQSDDVVVEGQDVNYIGSKAEAIAYLTAWQQCCQLKMATEVRKSEGAVSYGVISMYSGRPVPPGQSEVVVARPQVRAFRGTRVAIPDNIAEQFDVDDIRVGNVSTFLQTGSIPGVAWAVRLRDSLGILDLQRTHMLEVSFVSPALAEFGRVHSMPTCQTSQDLVMQVRNTSTATFQFRAFILGRYA